jgi:hypothetical protein
MVHVSLAGADVPHLVRISLHSISRPCSTGRKVRYEFFRPTVTGLTSTRGRMFWLQAVDAVFRAYRSWKEQ